MKIKKKCEICGREYLIKSNKKNTSKYCSWNCKYKSQIGKPPWNKGLNKETDERVKKTGESLKKRYKEDKNIRCGFKKGHQMHKGRKLTDDHKGKIGFGVKFSEKYQKGVKSKERSQKLSKALKGRTFSEEWKRKQALVDRYWLRGENNHAKKPEVRKKISKALTGKPRPKWYKEKMSKYWKKKWKEDKEFAQRWAKSINVRPNKKELFLINLFNLYGFNYKYVGDFKVVIDGKCPDFLDIVKGDKLIEFFGNYWHQGGKKEEEERIEHFRKCGFDCLVIWQDELKDLDKLLEKIKTFSSNDYPGANIEK